MRFILHCLRGSLLAALPFIAALLVAQSTNKEFPRVDEIQVKFKNFESISTDYVLGNVQLREGMLYNPTLVDQSIRTLYQTNYFEFVEVKVEKRGKDEVKVVFELVAKYTIRNIEFEGNEKYSNRRLLSKSEIEPQTPLDEYQVSLGSDKIEEYYVEKRFPDAEVDYRIDRDVSTGFATVTFEINHGSKVKIDAVQFEGNDFVPSKRLRKVLETKKANWLSWLTGSGKFDEKKFKEDLNLLRTFYRNEGYLDVVIDENLVQIDTDGNEMEITVPVTEGERYYLGEMSIENNTIYTNQELLGVVRMKTDDPFSPLKVDEAATAVREYYSSRGYLDAGVRAERVPNMGNRKIDIVFRVRESEKFYVESIKIEGNTKTKARVVIRELALAPGDVFDQTRMKTSEQRLKNTRFFDDVRLSPDTTNLPGRKDLSVIVREGRTGNFTFGAGFGSIEQAVIYFEVTQGNFDLFNWRSGFQGDGQKFRFRASIGSRSNEILISFEEPWLFEQRLAFGVELFRTESDFNSSEYNELRTGFELYLRRRLFELVEGRVSYRLELVEIFDVPRASGTSGAVPNDNIADVYQAAEGKDLVSKVGFTLLRDNRDSLIFTRRGNRTTLASEFAGVGGDVEYTKFEARTAQFIPTFETLTQTLSVIARAGSIIPYGDSDDVPFYDRFYLGGPDSLRGFEFRDVGPRDDDDSDQAIGGNTYGFISLEYQFRLAEPLGIVAFYDWGYVNTNENNFDPSDYSDNWGIGVRVMLLGSPLKLDLGFPITDRNGDAESSQFNFSFGTRF